VEFPLALTHIKITGLFLDLLVKGKLKGERWEEFQQQYNVFVLAILARVKGQFQRGDSLGTMVEEEARAIK
jgi:hypothetical protein